MKWYILRVAKGQDNRVKSAIIEQLQRYKVDQYVSDIIIPTEKEIKLKNGKKIMRNRNMLAGYVFVNADLTNDFVIDVITETPGSFGFMGDDKRKPTALKQSEVDKMLGTIVDDDEDIKNTWIKGQMIKINDGPFKNFEGRIEEIDEMKKKLKVEVKIFGRSTPLEVDYHSVEKVEGVI